MTELKWGEPPPRRNAHKWGPVVAQLKTRPGEWAEVLERGSTNYTNSVFIALKRLGAEATARHHGDGTASLWARWPA